MNLKIWKKGDEQSECKLDSELVKLLNSLDENVLDAVVGGHTHEISHQWINGVPVIHSVNGGYYFNIISLSFNKTSNSLIKEKTLIEGPIPTCSKIFENNKKCNYLSKSDAKLSGDIKKFKFHDNLVVPDNKIISVFQKWWNKVQIY